MDNNKKYFTKTLLLWNKKTNDRPMPWKGEKDPYKIWLSEIILQQTRVEQGWAYYDRFIAAFPGIEKLAKAPEQKVFKLWEGLGYYTRCKNLIATAKYIVKDRQAVFPDTYTGILALKGVGPYTAAAIASFAFNLPHAVVDGNVFRVLSRFFGIETPINSTTGKQAFTVLAEELLDKKLPGIYNQAIMDFGAVVCKPKNPFCAGCPLKNKCVAALTQKTGLLPVNTGKLVKKQRWFYYAIVDYKGKIYVRKRGAKDIWENLYEFILLEAGKLIPVEDLKGGKLITKLTGRNKMEILHVSKLYKQQLTHQTINGRFMHIRVNSPLGLTGYKAVNRKEIAKLPFPRFITGYLAENELQAFER